MNLNEKDGDLEPNEMENVRLYHGALMRELPEPKELAKRTPLYLKVFYVALFVWAISFLVFWTISWSWDAYESGDIMPDKETAVEAHMKPVEE